MHLLTLSAWSYKRIWSLSAGAGEYHLWEVNTVHHWLYSTIHYLLNSVKGHWGHYIRDKDTEVHPQFLHATISITFDQGHPISPLTASNTHTSKTSCLYQTTHFINLLHTALQFRPHPPSHQYMWPNFSYSLKYQKQLLSSKHSCSAHRKQDESCDWTLLGNEWPKVFSLLLTGAPPGQWFLSQGPLMWPSASALCHTTGHKVVLLLWRSKYLTNVCEVPSRVQFPSWRILLCAIAMLHERQTCLLPSLDV